MRPNTSAGLEKNMEHNLTSGSVVKNIAKFSLPYLLSYFLQTLYGMADLFIIGQFDGVAGTTAVAVGSQIMHMLTVMLVGLAMGSTVCIARGDWPRLYLVRIQRYYSTSDYRAQCAVKNQCEEF